LWHRRRRSLTRSSTGSLRYCEQEQRNDDNQSKAPGPPEPGAFITTRHPHRSR
jgi:hypothetical protein